MHSALHYLALAIATLPASALLAIIICHSCGKLNRWWDRHVTRQLGNHYRGESWHRQGRTAATQTRI
jgi:hypothetical protein